MSSCRLSILLLLRALVELARAVVCAISVVCSELANTTPRLDDLLSNRRELWTDQPPSRRELVRESRTQMAKV